ncbi:zeta toxin family protein [Phyllobacterium zundukense]|uniref:Zeta toxin family protein n=1 Tax=Phyllobacterium zundukense TaxID=1867719 RepID=A0ACD4CVX7_9HYPH|nr:zeta toxin family protein [Phyllobacterium zundukense]UXN57731.1 zeta toxin family protein [Phyllobacterium zundukense]
MAEEAVPGLLSAERNERIFRHDVLPDYLPEEMGRAARPRLILLGGQPGAGKTAVLIASHSELAKAGPTIRIVGDELRSYHPDFLTYQRQDPETASRFTQMDAGRWTEKLLAAAADRQVNIVFETTMRTPENVARVIRTVRDAGYEVDVRAVAVNPRLSWQGNLFRFEEMLHAGEAARIPPQHGHDAAVDGLRVSLEKLERERLVDRLQLRMRGGTVLYDNELWNSEWSRPPRARLALEQEQSRPLTRGELQRFADDWGFVLNRMTERKAPADRIAQVETRAAEDVSLLLAERRESGGPNGQDRDRTIFQRSADGLRLFVELYENTIRDAERRPIGNVEAHAAGRLTQTYIALRLVEVARELGLLPEDGKIVTTRAMVQDKRASTEFPAAHRLPADLAVETPDGTRRRLTEHFGRDLNRVAIDAQVFGPTDRMSRLANVADSWAEAAGMRKTFARAANSVADGRASADEAMTRMIEPGYAAAIARAGRRLERNMTFAERAAIATAIVDVNGKQFRPMRDDLRLRTVDLDNRARAKAMLEAVLAETARHDRLDPERRRVADAFVRGIAENEQTLGVGLERRSDPGRAPVPSSPLVPARHLPDLTALEIGERLQQSSRLADKRAEIEHLSRLVYGSRQAVSAPVRGIVDAQRGAAAGDDVRAGRLGEMAGEGSRWLRGATPERKTAEAHAPRLAAALADYGLAVDFERHQIVTQHREEQARQRVEVPQPSAALSTVLASEGDDRRRQLVGNDGLKRELERLSLAITKRFAPSDLANLKAGEIKDVATIHGIGEMRATDVRKVLRQVVDTRHALKVQSTERSRVEAMNLARR